MKQHFEYLENMGYFTKLQRNFVEHALYKFPVMDQFQVMYFECDEKVWGSRESGFKVPSSPLATYVASVGNMTTRSCSTRVKFDEPVATTFENAAIKVEESETAFSAHSTTTGIDSPATLVIGEFEITSIDTAVTPVIGESEITSIDAPANSVIDESDTTSIDAPVIASADAPVITSIDAPVTTSIDAPVTTSVDAPVTTSVDAPVITSIDAPVTTSVDAPVITSIDTPVITSIDAPAAPVIGESEITSINEPVNPAVTETELTHLEPPTTSINSISDAKDVETDEFDAVSDEAVRAFLSKPYDREANRSIYDDSPR
jgi:hypothetical protein